MYAGLVSNDARSVRIALVQMVCQEDPSLNLRRALELIEEAAGRGAQVVCLPELFRNRYFCQTEDHAHFALAESVPGPTTEVLGEVAARLGVVVVGSVFERRTAGLYHNTACVLDADGELVGIYRKAHIPDDPLYYEKFYFTPGDTGFRCFPTRFGRIGVLVCWDQWFPEAARLTALAGAELILYPTAIGWHPAEKVAEGKAQHAAWQTIQRSHAIANGCYVAAINRVGHESPDGGEGLEFWGQSFACNPSGELITQGSVDQNETVLVEIDRAQVNEARTHWPFLRDRRIDAYDGINRRFLDS